MAVLMNSPEGKLLANDEGISVAEKVETKKVSFLKKQTVYKPGPK